MLPFGRRPCVKKIEIAIDFRKLIVKGFNWIIMELLFYRFVEGIYLLMQYIKNNISHKIIYLSLHSKECVSLGVGCKFTP